MARTGVTEVQVHAAADALLKAGEKPTIERLRAHLGTGSPNTLLRALDSWWKALGQRMSVQETRLSLPNAPEDVTTAASRLWDAALTHAREWAQGRLATERESLDAQRAAFGELQQTWAAERVAVERDHAQAQANLRDLTDRLEELRSALVEKGDEVQELKDERTRLTEGRIAAEAHSAELQRRLDAQMALSSTKFEELRAHGLRSEERWLAEVDRLRHEIRNARKELEVERRQVQQAARQTQKELLEAARGRADAERALVAARAEAAALDRQLQRLAAAKPATTGKSERPKPARKTAPSSPRADAVRTRRPK